jgi:glycosyltransferase involved in cell wall biosynthesis
MQISVIIPVLNEQPSLADLHEEISAAAESHRLEVEFIYVDDGSTDGSWEFICQIAERDPRVVGLRFRRNFGKSSAIAAGLSRARYAWIATIDADLQDNFGEIPKLIAEANRGTDVVTGWKKVRHDPLTRRWASKVFNAVVNRMTGLRLHDHNCGFKLFRRDALANTPLYGDWHRFIPTLAASRGWQVAEVAVDHRPRQHGRSKYGWSRYLTGTLDLMTIRFLTSHRRKPEHVIGTIGILMVLVGMVGMAYLAVYWLLRVVYYTEWTPVHQRPLLLYAVALLLVGAQMLAIASLAALIVAHRANAQPDYSIREETGRGKIDSGC